MSAIIEENQNKRLEFRSPAELQEVLDRYELIDVVELEEAWYKNVRNWSPKDIIQGKLLIADYHWKLKREELYL